jgi:hypothetical protein
LQLVEMVDQAAAAVRHLAEMQVKQAHRVKVTMAARVAQIRLLQAVVVQAALAEMAARQQVTVEQDQILIHLGLQRHRRA